ncbi:glycerol-3-phosphate cytidylyltransferase [Thalassotalea crassostreae]|uniref:glycerol-3-phosphate cytidylyltransferase n=1 Tax=Thalassotalea crassostreae TaxID=1763536 RepID=UPI000837CD53|nr:glycerol-3-phosphate cytidylyltransferase [Thalassotalea crassostreae]
MTKKIITYGTFDMFHIGHLNLLKRIYEFGDELIVGVSTDEFNATKGKKSLIPFEQRAQIVEAIQYVSKVIPEQSWEQKKHDIIDLNIDIFVIGDDWKGKFDHLEDICRVIYLPRTEGVSTSLLKSSLNSIRNISKQDLINAFDILDRLRKDLE